MTMPARHIDPPPAARPASDELRDLARVVRQVIGVLLAHWDGLGMAPGHPYRHAARMLDSYLRRRYEV